MVSDINGHLIRENEAIGRSFLDMAFIIFFFLNIYFFIGSIDHLFFPWKPYFSTNMST